MNTGALFVGFALLLFSIYFLAEPYLRLSEPLQAMSAGERATSARRKEDLLLALRELDFDFQLAKINEGDYKAARSTLLAEATTAMDALGRRQTEVDAEIEEQVKRIRTMNSGSRACTSCGAVLQAADRFCSRCGQITK